MITVGELLFGAAKSSRQHENRLAIESFISQNTVLQLDFETALAYGSLKLQLKQQGTPIPENDIWIAASAIRWKLPLVTLDTHFQHIAGLSIVAWH